MYYGIPFFIVKNYTGTVTFLVGIWDELARNKATGIMYDMRVANKREFGARSAPVFTHKDMDQEGSIATVVDTHFDQSKSITKKIVGGFQVTFSTVHH